MDGVLFDVEHNAYWHEEWGDRPAAMTEAIDLARRRLAEAPTMVPVFGHRYLPAGRGTFGHPVLSMHQTDIVFYGLDLADYIRREFTWFGIRAQEPKSTVAFWSDFVGTTPSERMCSDNGGRASRP
ncbi:hypothetical protein [Microtetraspora fusca]|uniref:hypothetical protein n=1 Tax=Microtetraspora fusca TaxID=1997 RepID=UPI00082F579C|nr:hypothetical protein [Microtetraspora fusca]